MHFTVQTELESSICIFLCACTIWSNTLAEVWNFTPFFFVDLSHDDAPLLSQTARLVLCVCACVCIYPSLSEHTIIQHFRASLLDSYARQWPAAAGCCTARLPDVRLCECEAERHWKLKGKGHVCIPECLSWMLISSHLHVLIGFPVCFCVKAEWLIACWGQSLSTTVTD